jgi:hypothetical protein
VQAGATVGTATDKDGTGRGAAASAVRDKLRDNLVAEERTVRDAEEELWECSHSSFASTASTKRR